MSKTTVSTKLVSTTTLTAGQKAAATRKANALFALRSARAMKAAETRRTNRENAATV